MWKCVVESRDLKTYECSSDSLKVCIEARKTNDFWEIYKIYHIDGLTFTEEYEAKDSTEAEEVISKIKKEIVDKRTLKKIDKIRKNLDIKVKRIFKENNVEKWTFSINSDSFDNYVIIRYGPKEIELDIMSPDKFKFVETEILDELFRIFALSEFNKEIIQNFFFFSKKSCFLNDVEEQDMLSRIEVGFKIDSDDEFIE